MLQQFINRKEELGILNERYLRRNPEFLIVYGRRRVGKTELITHSIKNRRAIYFLAEERLDRENIKELQALMGDLLKDEEFKLINFADWVDIFKSFLSRNKERCVIVIDEFPYLVKQNPAIPSKFQKIWDMHMKNTENVLILVGSSVSMMEKLLGAESPLHGRRTGQIEVKRIPIREIHKFVPNYSWEDIVRVYGCADGIPLYLRQIDSQKKFFENLEKSFLRRDSFLYSEAESLLRQEFRDTANYFAILKALSFGNTKQNEIVNATGIDKSIISKYLQNLEAVRVIKRDYLVTDPKEKRKNARFAFTDNYFKFWFRFIYPNKSSIERGDSQPAMANLEEDYNVYLGHIFEEAALELLWSLKPFKFTRAGRWWHKDKEIDLVALNDETKEIRFFECKWSSLKETESRKILADLKEKSKFVDWNKDKRKEYFGIIAKSIKEKEKLKKEGILAFDLEDFS